MDRATSTVYLSPAICAHWSPFLETAHILWGVDGFYTWALARLIYLSYLQMFCPCPGMQSAAAHCVPQKFEDIFNWTPGITLKSL